MRAIGFSTGALSHGDFRGALSIIRDCGLPAIELSALRETELPELMASIRSIDLSSFAYVSIHAPSAYPRDAERAIAEALRPAIDLGFPVVLHPDAICDFQHWTPFGKLLCVENMDKRKPIGRNAEELEMIFKYLPEASLCFDIGHARQVDPTMCWAAEMLFRHAKRLAQLHVSDVNSRSLHERLNRAAMNSFRKIAQLIPEDVPLILESPLAGITTNIAAEIRLEVAAAASALPLAANAETEDVFAAPDGSRPGAGRKLLA